MRLDEFLTLVRDRGEYHSEDEAEQVSRAVLWVVASRVGPEEATALASDLPAPLAEALRLERGRPESFGRDEFLQRVAQQTGARPRTAEWDAGAVLSTLTEAVPGERVDRLLTHLPTDCADLFGRTAGR
ncbi:hypothetical protein SAM23877_1208 [Streptomyces ambofaciens ATCC 23877]|uniref:DUF2267 domain-containing protein n=2 Tax=Streptomyces ambofaciens TaxID=1889 RepID=A3KK64_STRA7|nr:DUF2267 domain-containing protein [Streptomyces ambofaciens]AKZ54257.1 hypothetical protein SAM23877_1208 [Streptomyces ambofaciens ATCC 23877]ANB05016.1 hypothetical protein SAM40697_1055 [Streptomyces ambofaciens]CAJ90100.1 conserved hypothetical protein [Streptomyces ambofaciens ATCC 23877]